MHYVHTPSSFPLIHRGPLLCIGGTSGKETGEGVRSKATTGTYCDVIWRHHWIRYFERMNRTASRCEAVKKKPPVLTHAKGLKNDDDGDEIK